MNNLRNVLMFGMCAFFVLGCEPSETPEGATGPQSFDKSTACALDGMLLADYPGPKAQILYAGVPKPEFFCDPLEMFNLYLNPEQKRKVLGVFVQDMSRTSWEQPRDAWIDAKSAFYVVGSKKKGAMGATFGTFSQEADAQKFVAEHGGKVLRFEQITPAMVKLDGGALHDQKM